MTTDVLIKCFNLFEFYVYIANYSLMNPPFKNLQYSVFPCQVRMMDDFIEQEQNLHLVVYDYITTFSVLFKIFREIFF